MKKFLLITLLIVAVGAIALGGTYWYRSTQRNFPSYTEANVKNFANLDHDIYVPNTSLICDNKHDGFDVYVGPTGWPWGDPVEWETALYEDASYYYARLIFHEWCLWWSWDDPYIVCKIPKANVGGDLRTDEKLRWQVLWDITHTTLRTYDYKPYMPNPVIQKINGHTVTFGNYACKYEKYFVISDTNHPW